MDGDGSEKLALDFLGQPSSGGAMSTDPPDADPPPSWPESPFLIALWEHLDAAEDLSVCADALQRLDEVQAHCEAAIALIQRWKTHGAAGL